MSPFLVPGCMVPLKKVPVQPGPTQRPHIDFAQLAEFSKAAGNVYESNSVIEAAYGKENVIIRDLPKNQGRYFIYTDRANHIQTISVRGTANEGNAWSDLNSIKLFDERLEIFIHQGFKAAEEELYSDALPFLHKDYKTRITGHSLGGAVACVLMMDLLHDGYPIDKVLTFGQPKVTNEDGGKKYEGTPYFRIINDEDVVPQLPPSNVVYDLSGPYDHFGPEITLLEKMWTYSTVYIPKDLIGNQNWKKIDPKSVLDHQIKKYQDRIEALK